MKVFTTVLAGALLLGAGLSSVTGCSDDDEPAAAAGAGGSAGGAGGSGGSTGGTAGRGGSGGSAGRGGSAGTGAMCDKATVTPECKTRGMAEGVCSSLLNCSCDNCACELEACENVPTCKAVRACATRTGCCPSDEMGCTGGPPCTDACATEISAAAGDMGLQLILTVSACTYSMHTCKSCRVGDAGTDAGRDAAGD